MQPPPAAPAAPASEPSEPSGPAAAPPSADGGPGAAAPAALGALSLPARLLISLTVGVLGVYTCWHMAAVFLFVAPGNTLRDEHWDSVSGYVYPEFEQNWKLFAPNPLQRDVAVHARAEIREDDGATRTTDWIDLTAIDVRHIEHNLVPSHTAQNELRRAWDFYSDSHDDGTPNGLRGELSASYVHRIALLRLSGSMDLDHVRRIQLRSATTVVDAPAWSGESVDTSTSYDEQHWWVVTSEDLPGGQQ